MEVAAPEEVARTEPRVMIAWHYFMFMLSVMALILLAIETFTSMTVETSVLLRNIDTAICLVFLIDFVWNVTQSRPVWKYLRWGWLDLLSSIPMFPLFRIARFARIAKIIRVLRVARATKHTLRIALLQKARSTFATVAFCSAILILVSTLGISIVEPAPPEAGTFWWSMFTLIMGEYGEFFPATTEGRIITVLLITSGMALFGTFTAYIASYFLEEEQKQDEKRDFDIMHEVARLSEEVALLRRELKSSQSDRDDRDQAPES